MNTKVIAKAVLAAALPLSLAITAIADDRTDLRDRSDPGALNTNNQSIMSRQDSMVGSRKDSTSNQQLARGLERRDGRGVLEESQAEVNKIAADSTQAYRALTKGDHPIPSSIIERAQCIAIIPNIITAAAVVGGSHGDGIVTCKSGSKWSSPDFMDLSAASFGAQLGAKSTDVVLYFTSPESVAALKRGKFTLGADASVVAGTFDRSFDTSGAGVIAYQRSSGAFLGASLTGGSLSHDQDSNRQFYGKDVKPADVLENRVATDRENPLASILPQG